MLSSSPKWLIIDSTVCIIVSNATTPQRGAFLYWIENRRFQHSSRYLFYRSPTRFSFKKILYLKITTTQRKHFITESRWQGFCIHPGICIACSSKSFRIENSFQVFFKKPWQYLINLLLSHRLNTLQDPPDSLKHWVGIPKNVRC